MKKTNNILMTTVAATSSLALALAMFGCAPAPAPQPEPEPEPSQIGVKLDVSAEGWDAETSTPVIASITQAKYEQVYVCTAGERFNTTEEADAHLAEQAATEVAAEHAGYDVEYVDDDGNVVEPKTTYHEIGANEEQVVELDEGPYTLELISPINADGSIYAVPEDATVDAKEITDDAEAIALTLIPADQVSPEQIDGVIAGITLAVLAEDGLGDEALIERAVTNAAANPNVSAEEVEAVQEQAQSAVESGNAQAVASMAAAQPARDASGNTTNKTNTSASVSKPAQNAPSQNTPSAPAQTPSTPSTTPSNGGNASSGGSNSNNSGSSAPAAQPSKPAHEHNWVAQTTQKKVIDSPAVSKLVCSCGNAYSSKSEWTAHNKPLAIAGEGHSYSAQSTPEKSHMETVTTGYKCSCGATK